jgi:lipoprotein-releasing system ATP-binding protein
MPAYIRHSAWGWWAVRSGWRRRAEEMLERVGLGNRMTHKPRELSGGEMQRAAVARALLAQPRVLFADEPTGNLDPETGVEIVRLLRELNRDDGLTIVMVTHNLEVAAATDRVVRMSHGRLTDDAPGPFPHLMAV